MIETILKDLILQYIGILRPTRKGWQSRNCMMCHTQGESADKRGRFGITFAIDGQIGVQCFNCSFRASFTPAFTFSKTFESFLLEIGIPLYDIKKLNFELYKQNNQLESTKVIKLRGAITHKWTPMDLPHGSMNITSWLENGCNDVNFLKVVEYAMGRNITNFGNFHWSPSPEYLFNRRLILPFFYKGRIVGYTGRYFGNTPSKAITKYLNQVPDSFIYNLDAQNDFDRKYVILNEGVMDAYFMDGISTGNSTINDDQIQIINSLGKIIIVCPDKDKGGDKFVNIALDQGWKVSFPEWGMGVKDAAKATQLYGRILTVKSVIDSAETNPMKIKLKWRLSKNDRYQGVYN